MSTSLDGEIFVIQYAPGAMITSRSKYEPICDPITEVDVLPLIFHVPPPQ